MLVKLCLCSEKKSKKVIFPRKSQTLVLGTTNSFSFDLREQMGSKKKDILPEPALIFVATRAKL